MKILSSPIPTVNLILVLGVLSLPLTSQRVSASPSLTLIYSGEESAQLGLHGCGTEQVGGLSRRQTVIQSLREKHADSLNLHTGNILSPTNPSNELIYQIALEALGEMKYDAVFLGPQDLSLSIDSLQALHANHPNLPIVCTNLFSPNTSLLVPYIVQNTSNQIKIALVGLISKSHETEVTAYNPGITLTSPEEALEALGGEIVQKSDVVVGVFHGSEIEAHDFAERFPWLDVLILARNESADVSSPIIVRNTAIVTNTAKGEAVGVLEVELNANLDVVSRSNQHVAVSEKIEPDENLELLLALYHSLTEDDELGDNGDVPDDGAIYVTYFHNAGVRSAPEPATF